MSNCLFSCLHPKEQTSHIHRTIDFFADVVDLVAVLPLHFAAENRVDPGVHRVLDVSPKVKVGLLYLSAALVVVEGALGHSDLEPVLVIAEQKPDQSAQRNRKEPSYVRDDLVDFSNAPRVYFDFPIHGQSKLSQNHTCRFSRVIICRIIPS